MAVSSKLYGSVIAKAFNKEVDWDSDTVKIALCTSSYTPDQDAHDYFNDLTNEVSGTGYTAGGLTLSNKGASYNSGTNTWTFTADPAVWSSSTITARYAVVYVSTGVGSTSPLICFIDFGADVASTGAAFTVTFGSGVFTLSVA